MLRAFTFLLLVALAGLAACVPATGSENAAPTTAAEDRTPTEATRPAGKPADAELVPTDQPLEAMPVLPLDTPIVVAAQEDLAKQLNIPVDDIEVIAAEPVIWSDGSLGCPQPDVMYTQALVDGAFIQLRVDDTIYNYHSGGSQGPFLCESAMTVAPGELPPGATSSAGS